MENGGNAKVNAIFEGFLNVVKPTQSANGQVRERFIRDKYERRKFYDAKAFDKCSQMESERGVDEVVSDVNQRRLSASRTPSDAARKRVEERAARTHASPRSGTTSTVKSPSAPVSVTKSFSSPAPAVDLLDFGDFDSVEATSAVQASGGSVAAPTSSAPQASPNSNEPALDLFTNMTTEDIVQQQPSRSQQSSQPQQKKMTADDIMSMFNTPAAGQQNPMFPSNGPNVSMINGMHPQQMAMMNGMIPPQQQVVGGMVNGMNPHQQQMGGGMMSGMMNPQQQMQMMQMNGMNQQQQMQMMNMQNMMGQMNMGMMGGQGGGRNNNMNMMQQQGGGGMPQMNAMLMGHQSHNMMGHQGQLQQTQQQQQQQEPSKQQRGGTNHQAFADFGSFGR